MEFTPTQLKEFKKQAMRVYEMYEPLANYFDNPIVKVISVLLQNLSFDGSGCANYSHDKEVERVNEIRRLLNAIKEYNSFYLTDLAFEEVDSIFVSFSFTLRNFITK